MNRRSIFRLIPEAIAACAVGATPATAKGSWSIFPDWRQNRHVPEYKGCTVRHANGDPHRRVICRGEPHPGYTMVYDLTESDWDHLKEVADFWEAHTSWWETSYDIPLRPPA